MSATHRSQPRHLPDRNAPLKRRLAPLSTQLRRGRRVACLGLAIRGPAAGPAVAGPDHARRESSDDLVGALAPTLLGHAPDLLAEMQQLLRSAKERDGRGWVTTGGR